MKIFFNTFLILNTLIETMAGTAQIIRPGGIPDAGQGDQWSMHYGFAALAIASASLWLWRYRTNLNTVTAVLGILCTFHAGICFSLIMAGDQQAGVVIHSVFAVAFIFLFSQRTKWCSE